MDLMFWVSFLAFWGCTLGQTRQFLQRFPKSQKSNSKTTTTVAFGFGGIATHHTINV